MPPYSLADPPVLAFLVLPAAMAILFVWALIVLGVSRAFGPLGGRRGRPPAGHGLEYPRPGVAALAGHLIVFRALKEGAMRLRTPIVCALVLVAPLSAQRDDSKPTHFDVASIKEITHDDPRHLPCGLPGMERSGNRIRIPLTQLCGLIRVAYDVGEHQITGIPEKQDVGAFNFFEVEALVETVTAPSIEEIRLMLRTLLAERFRLQVRREPVEMPVFVLAPAEGELKTTACADPKAASSYVPGRIVSCTPPLPMARFAQFLSRETGRMVLDQTGREAMTFELHWLPDTAQPQPDSPPSLFTALREQLGLKLEAQRAPVDAIVVVHAERPSAN